jgi:hypothetical protein
VVCRLPYKALKMASATSDELGAAHPIASLPNDILKHLLHLLDRPRALTAALTCRAWRTILRDVQLWRCFCIAAWPSVANLPVQDWFRFFMKRSRTVRQERDACTRAWLTDVHLLLEVVRGDQRISLSLCLADGHAFGYDEDTRDGTPGLYGYKLFVEWPTPELQFNLAEGCAAAYVSTCHLWRASTQQMLLLASDGQHGRRPLGQCAPSQDDEYEYDARPLHEEVLIGGPIPRGAGSMTCVDLLPRRLEADEDCLSEDDIVLRHRSTSIDGRLAEHSLFRFYATLDVTLYDVDAEDRQNGADASPLDVEFVEIAAAAPKVGLHFNASHERHVDPPLDAEHYAAMMELDIASWPQYLSTLEWD